MEWQADEWKTFVELEVQSHWPEKQSAPGICEVMRRAVDYQKVWDEARTSFL